MLLASNRMPFRAITTNLGFVLFKHEIFLVLRTRKIIVFKNHSSKLIVNCTPNHAITTANQQKCVLYDNDVTNAMLRPSDN